MQTINRRQRTAACLAMAAALAACGGGDAADPAAGSASPAASGRARALAITPQQAALARWSAPVGLSIVPAAGAVLGNGKVLFWAAETRNSFASGAQTYTALFDPATNSATEALVSNTGHDMFCPGTATLPDGRLLVNGGLSSGATSLYNPQTNTWSAAAGMNVPRAYNASVVQADGSVLTMGGSWAGANAGVRPAEVWTAASGWRTLAGLPEDPFRMNGATPREAAWIEDSHFALIPTANGRVLYAGPGVDMAWVDTRGNGQWAPAGRRADDRPTYTGNYVMYEAGKIFKTSGTNLTDRVGMADTFVIDTTSGGVQTRRVASMSYPRVYSNSVVLPNGQIVVVGGQTNERGFTDDFSVLAAELWDPETERFTTLPSMNVPRNYHSVAMLLPDGRVVSAGGGLCACAADHPDLQMLSPPYLFNADGSAATRPVITGAPVALAYGSTVSVNTDSAVSAFALVRIGAATHTVNNDQRRLALTFTAGAGNSYQVQVPSNAGLLLPGAWMLFAMNANGTPSVAKIVTVAAGGDAPKFANPGDLSATVGSAIDVTAAATSTTGTLSYSATGLPAGLSIDSATGRITGSVASAGRWLVTLRVSNGTHTVSTDLVIRVDAPGTGTGLLGQYHPAAALGGTALAQRTEAPNVGIGATRCAGEGETCNFGGTQLVSYGAGGSWATRIATGSIACGVNGFGGDPTPNVLKSCYVGASGVPAAVTNTPFSVRWTGAIEAVGTGSTRFSATAGPGLRVWIDNRLVIDTSTAPAVGWSTASGSAELVSGRQYAVLIEALPSAGAVQLQWQPPGDQPAAVPASRLFPSVPSATNLARGQPATQNSLAYDGNPQRAVDGNTDGNWGNNSVTHTAGGTQDWWQVDLGRKQRIDIAQLWNRTDCCADRLQNFSVFVSDTDMSGRSLDQLKADASVTARTIGATNIAPTLGIPVGVAGRYLRVQLAGGNPLSLAEVQVFGSAAYQTPVINAIANQQTAQGASVSLAVSASDPGGNPLTYSASGLPAGLAINAQTGTITGSPTTAGSSNVTVTATNGGGLAAGTSFTWTVQAPMPQVTALPAPVAASGSTVNYAPVVSNASGAQFSWNFGDASGDTAFTSNAATSHVYAAPGVYSVTLTLRSADGQATTQRFVQAIVAAGTGAPARASSPIVLEPRSGASARLWVVNADNDTVSVFDTANNTKLAEIAVGSGPRTLALAADGRVWVVNKQAASISIVNASSLAVAQTVSLPRASQPYGIVLSPSDGSAFVTLEATGQLLKLNGSSGAVAATLAVGSNPRHLAMSASGDRLLVSRFITPALPGEATANVQTSAANGAALGGEVLLVNPATLALQATTVLTHSERTDAENQGRGIPNYLGAAAISPDGKTAWVPGKQDNIKRGSLRDGAALNFQSTVRSISARIDLTTFAEDAAGRVDHDNAGVASAAVYHPNGAYLFAALETNRQVAVLDAAGKRELFRYEVGLAPQGVAVSADGLKLYVDNFMGRSISVIDLAPLVNFGQTGAAPTATLASVGTEKLAAAVLKGKQLFYDARDPRLARDSYMSCASCHNDGGHDGRTWDFTGQGEGLRNTPSLRGRAGTAQGFVHWSANFDEVQDFEGQIRAFAGGAGLMTDADFNAGTRSQPLGDRKAGLSADLDALAAYLASLNTFAPTPFRNADATLTSAAQSGKAVFTARCASCHGGVGFTLSADGAQLKNIGTVKAASGKRLYGTLSGIDIPTLRDVWATAPYLHDGSAATLSAAVAVHNTFSLNATDLSNVVAYVQQIGGEEPGGLIACATEGGTCAIPAGITADVHYGANGSQVMRSGLSGNVTCGVATFGVDPVGGAYKVCAYVPTGVFTRTACGGPGALCSLPAGAVGDIYYGTGTKYAVRTGVTGAICGNAFQDANGGAAGQTCGYVVTGAASPAPASALTACAGEGGSCVLPAGVSADVYYGVNGKYALRSGLTGTVGCNTGSFGGDPVPNVVKSCGYVVTNTVAKTACTGDGGFCALPAGRSGDVYYGGGGKFSVRTGMTGVFCAAAQFGGDPSPGVAKSCTYVVAP